MLESQKKWYKPDLRSIGWHVGCKFFISPFYIFWIFPVFQSGTSWAQSGLPSAVRWDMHPPRAAKRCIKAL